MDLFGYVCTLAAIVTILITTAQGAIECYCNRPECKATHLCLSHLEQCYSKFNSVYTRQKNDTNSDSKDEHGCVDMVNTRESTMCEGRGVVVKALTAQESLIMCCSDNMCNYKEKQDRPIVQVDIMDSVKSKPEEVVEKPILVREERPSAEGLKSDEDLMFQAAVIAVPIAGGLILVILILMAVRMLREDYNRRSDSQTGLMKAHSFIEQHFVKKDDKKSYAQHKNTTSSSPSSSIKNKREYSPAPVHSKNSIDTQTSRSLCQWSETNECLIARGDNPQQYRTSPSKDNTRQSQVCVSLLSPSNSSMNNSDIAIV